MPEGPELRFLYEYIKSSVVNNTVTSITALSKRKVPIPGKLHVNSIGVKGKLIWFECGNYFIHIHLGLAGWLYFKEQQYTKYIINFINDKNLYLDDMRKLSKISLFKKNKHLEIINELGVDIFTKEFTVNAFNDKITNVNKIISAFLLDQSNFAGIGNYIKNESLYIAKINPKRLTGSLDTNDIINLYNAIRYISFSNLFQELNNAGLKVNKELKSVAPKKLAKKYKFKVYGNTRDSNGNPVTFEMVSGRKTYYVKSIQK